MSKPCFQKRNSVQRFKPRLKNAALGYIEKQKKKKKKLDGSIAAFFKTRLKPCNTQTQL